MRIRKIELVNVKCYKNLSLTFSDNINLLVGVNNSGKSTIIKSLLNLQYKTFEKSDIRSLESYAKIFTDIDQISKTDNMTFLTPNRPEDLEISSSLKILWESNQNIENSFYANSKHKFKRLEYD